MELRIHNLKKSYGRKQALDGVSLNLTEGVYGLLGPNGAGKSTIMNIITGNVSLDAGSISYDGYDIFQIDEKFKSLVGYMPQQQAFYPNYSVQRFMQYIASLKSIPRTERTGEIDRALQLVSLDDKKSEKIGNLSGGMKQRLMLAQAILGNPDIIILDEPTAGLDPKQRIAVRNIISKIALHKIVLISTHVVQDIEYIAKEIIILSDGRILKQDIPSELLKEIQSMVWEISVDEAMVSQVSRLGKVSNIAKNGSRVTIKLISENKPHEQAYNVSPTLEDVYLFYFGEGEEL